MTVKSIEAVIGCDNCGAEFRMDIDPARAVPFKWSMWDVAVDAIRGGHMAGAVGLSGLLAGSPSVQADLHLCVKCTNAVDVAYPEDHLPTDDEVRAALTKVVS